ncbi:2OG-Fe(II) oxygenase [Sphingomonas humi]|uniref:2OG-Fe(II) oxygenase n=1 Tax=Sphingomonas humi TaxID=335630 RepID=A0ABP7RG75_9SPHN
MTAFELPLPPVVRVPDFLAGHEHRALLDWVISAKELFRPATITHESKVDPTRRISLTTAKLGGLEPMLRERMLDALPRLMADTGTAGPPPTSLELELAAHGDGAYFRPHTDIQVGRGRHPVGAKPGEDRVLSAVYYFHVEPKAFSGGELRLFSFGPTPEDDDNDRTHVDVEPAQNLLVAFPSWAPHEVRPVSCPGNRFEQFRFSLNCWYCRTLG